MGSERLEHDTFGTIEVPADRLWGAQTQRSLEHFAISGERMPRELMRALALVKRAAASVNLELGLLDAAKAARDRAGGRRGARRPATTASSRSWCGRPARGTQTNMNMNEVLANRATRAARRRARRRRAWCTPTTTSTAASRPTTCSPPRCTWPRCSAIEHGAAAGAAHAARHAGRRRRGAFADIVKIGRTHLQDATPLTLGQEISRLGGAARPRASRTCRRALPHLLRAGARRHRGRHRPQRAPASSAQRVAAELAQLHRPAVRRPRRTSSRRWPRTTRWCMRTARSRRWPRR